MQDTYGHTKTAKGGPGFQMGNTAQSPKNKMGQIAAAVATVSPTATSSSNEATVSKVADLYELMSPMVQGVWVGNRSAVARLLSSGNSANKPIGHPGGTFPLIYFAA